MSKFCSNCGKKLEESDLIFIDDRIINKDTKSITFKGKGIASMILGIIGVVFAIASIVLLCIIYSNSFINKNQILSKLLLAVILNIVPITTGIIGLVLSCSERKINKNGFNISGLWLGIISITFGTISLILTLVL